MAYIESHQALSRHRKVLYIVGVLKVDRHKLLGHLHELWWWGLDNADAEGNLGDIPETLVAEGAGWPLRGAKAFVGALLECGGPGKPGLLERTENGYRLHDWETYAGAFTEQRTLRQVSNREAQRRRRARLRGEPEPTDGDRDDRPSLRHHQLGEDPADQTHFVIANGADIGDNTADRSSPVSADRSSPVSNRHDDGHDDNADGQHSTGPNRTGPNRSTSPVDDKISKKSVRAPQRNPRARAREGRSDAAHGPPESHPDDSSIDGRTIVIDPQLGDLVDARTHDFHDDEPERTKLTLQRMWLNSGLGPREFFDYLNAAIVETKDARLRSAVTSRTESGRQKGWPLCLTKLQERLPARPRRARTA